jgi:hypothetical protein
LEVLVKKLLLVVGTTALMAACSDSMTAPSGGKRAAPSDRISTDFECRSGYIVAYDEFGNPYCAPAPTGASRPTRP